MLHAIYTIVKKIISHAPQIPPTSVPFLYHTISRIPIKSNEDIYDIFKKTSDYSCIRGIRNHLYMIAVHDNIEQSPIFFCSSQYILKSNSTSIPTILLQKQTHAPSIHPVDIPHIHHPCPNMKENDPWSIEELIIQEPTTPFSQHTIVNSLRLLQTLHPQYARSNDQFPRPLIIHPPKQWISIFNTRKIPPEQRCYHIRHGNTHGSIWTYNTLTHDWQPHTLYSRS